MINWLMNGMGGGGGGQWFPCGPRIDYPADIWCKTLGRLPDVFLPTSSDLELSLN